jgi:PPOX class probable F420-dependent enzyme
VGKGAVQVLADDVRTLLDRSRIGHLATADRRLRPHVVPLCYAREDDRLYFVVDEKPKQPGKRLKRMRNIAENPAVALVVDVYDEDWRKLEYVLVGGTAETVTRADEFRRVLALLRARYPQYEAMRLEAGRNEVVRITPTSVHHWKASTASDKPTR